MTITTDEKDWLLEGIVNAVNGTQKEVPITILVDGIMISGSIVSGHYYLEMLNPRIVIEPLKNTIENIELDILKRSIKQVSDNYQGKNQKVGPGASYIHLKDAKFHRGSKKGIESQKGVFWRGSLE